MSLKVRVLRTHSDVDAVAHAWNDLAGDNPFLRWEWLGSWWEALGRRDVTRKLYVLVVSDQQRILGFTPWFVENRPYRGNTVCFLGSGKACTDHLSLLCKPQDTNQVADAVAKYLTDTAHKNSRTAWNHIELIGVNESEPTITRLLQTMRSAGNKVNVRPGSPCYEIDLPSSWAEYTQRRSKSGRHECRKLQKLIDSGEITFFVPKTINELESAWFRFVELHQVRRIEMGDTGCFDHPDFSGFLWNASCRLIRSNLLHLTLTYYQGRPIAAQYSLKTDRAFYYYQSGMVADADHVKPGLLILQQTIQQSISDGLQRYDMLRGDEAYKLRWRAIEQPTIEVRIAAAKLGSTLQHSVWQLGTTVTDWAKSNFIPPSPSSTS